MNNNLLLYTGRSPFKPFSIVLVNGSTYRFETRNDFGITRNGSTLVYFGEDTETFVLIDTSKISEILDSGGRAFGTK